MARKRGFPFFRVGLLLVIGSLGGRLNHEVGEGVRRICPGT